MAHDPGPAFQFIGKLSQPSRCWIADDSAGKAAGSVCLLHERLWGGG
jgi:hypothetical protein